MQTDVLVIGGGASGMMAAIAAAREGANVVLAEKNEKLGKKIYITGKGRCNLTNDCSEEAFFAHVVSNPRFLYSAYRAFGKDELMALVEAGGTRLKTERGNRVFPVSDHASDVTKALAKHLRDLSVDVLLNTKVRSLSKNGDLFEAELLSARQDGRETGRRRTETLFAKRVILCTGGLSYPSTGSTGDGYRFAGEAGHTVREPVPALVPLLTEEDVSSMAGLTLKNVSLRVFEEHTPTRPLFSELGELLFTHTGISGPLALTASSLLASRLSEGKHFTASLDLKPGMSEEELDRRMLKDFSKVPNQELSNALSGLLLSALRGPVLSQAGISGARKVHDLTREERRAVASAMKDLRFPLKGTGGFSEAVITQGGVNVKEVVPSTMESRKCPGLYFAGEVLDLDAFTGGFNLQIAWTTGHAAGTHAALSIRKEQP